MTLGSRVRNRVLAQEEDGVSFGAFSASQGNHKIVESPGRRVEFVTVERKEDDRSNGAHALVAVDEGMVLDEMEEIQVVIEDMESWIVATLTEIEEGPTTIATYRALPYLRKRFDLDLNTILDKMMKAK